MSFAQTDVARRPGPDAQAMMLFDSRKKSVIVAYLFWFFFCGFGAHRFYAGRTASGLAMLILSILGWVLVLVAIGIFVLAAVWVWALIDAFLIPGMIRSYNGKLAAELGGGDGLLTSSNSKGTFEPDPEAGARADAAIARYLEHTRKTVPAPAQAETRPVVKTFGTRARAP